MKKELTPNEIIFCASCKDAIKQSSINRIPEVMTTLNKIKKALTIDKDGYNIYYVDSFSKEKLEFLQKYIDGIYENYPAPKDICYVTSQEKIKPIVLFLQNGKGTLLKDMIEDIKEKYLKCIVDFYSSSSDDEKENILEEINEKRNSYISALMAMAKSKNFDVKSTSGGFVFIPLKDEGIEMTQDEYDELENDTQESIEKQASNLKKEAEAILEKLKDIELKSIEKLKDLYRIYIKDSMQKYKDDLLLEFISDDSVYRYLIETFDYLEDEIIECYTINLEDDEEDIQKIFSKYVVNVIVDNSELHHPKVIYEDDPTIGNLIGNIEYRNNNGGYTTDISLITAGSLVKANEGCLIVRLSSLINSPSSYYYLKKALIHGQVDYSYTRSYLDVLSITGLKPQPIQIKLKVILIGDYESFEILYDKDEDFKRIFPLRIDADSDIKYNEIVRNAIIGMVKNKINKDNLLNVTDDAYEEIIKYLARVVGERNKVSVDDYYINKLLYLSNNNARIAGKKNIDKQDIRDIAYEEEKILEEVMDSYKDNKILITTSGKKVGIINALAVVGTSCYSFGKPMRVTCLALQGEGRIIDIHKECRLSGNIHEKSISILKGLVSSLISPYEKLPVDLQLSFEQTYGMIEGDSASVAEIICILSALSKKGIRQNIAVTGSINQLGEIQPIGGVNEKIEGFHKVCSIIGEVEGTGVLIPSTNVSELILKSEVEEDIKNNKFHIYTMDTLEDAIEVLILDEGESVKSFFKEIEDEILKYKGGKKKNK
ncbi:AAA family ATPase [Clostridium saccharobutylicum]|uniref:endopeptidase La n=1 Tax=Clostridium saccharobutylicum DSM 13864 TaxID=1345695 RepID=U5MRL6_CLOSA|nr:AAA family ATPase [Clostridium saccharobutylicum]AGX42072.1 putative Lon protease [Clostridium saccharobutylicum DSM 13864]AQR89350.1 Lon protease [Clostridium saccharobutylicum]AQR99251.1 Lon protease [Clostridium saccharobutylicum]AQS13239.1 Lon protease [Clostridium saccharobutylicum]MBA2907768.1 putative ATP-dependent protease [Clostridium saccharobutylicum]